MGILKYAGTLKADMGGEIAVVLGSAGVMNIYSGTQPTNPDTALSSLSVMLASLALSATAGTASSGVFTFGTITTESAANATGTATFGSFVTSSGARMIDFDVGTTSSFSLDINSTAISSGASVACSAATITNGN